MQASPGVRFPTADELLSHGFDFRPHWWQPRVEPSWGQFLSNLPVAERADGYRHITRRDLLARAHGAVPDGVGPLLLGCYVWGTGTSAWLVGRRARVFRDTSQRHLDDALSNAREILKARGPMEAYRALHDGGPNRIKHMRASFFTKFLYACDAPGNGDPGRALILDRFVAIALNDLHGWSLPERGGWSPATYGDWLNLAQQVADAESQRTGEACRVDAVEMAYFAHGKALSALRRAKAVR